MGIAPAPEKCFITDQPTRNVQSPVDAIEYEVDYDNYTLKLSFYRGYQNTDSINENKYILKGLILNGRWPIQPDNIYDEEILNKIIKEGYYPKTPKEKLNNLILFIHSLQEYEGEKIDIYSKIDSEILLPKLFFKKYDEYLFYLNTLKQQGLIECIDESARYGNELIKINITFSGLKYIISIQEEGKFSKNCFIAMSFSDEMQKIRESIKEACRKTGFIPIIIDEITYQSEQTINDAIISFLKKCRFCIADFTEQKDGVYFESGYALGRGIPVIYTCKSDWFDNSHFDINHFPHIIYETPEELETKLINKIEAFIN